MDGRAAAGQVRDSEEGALVAAVAGAVLLRPGTGGLWFRPAGAAWVDVGGDKEVFPTLVRSSAIGAAVRVGGRFVALGSVRGGGTEEGPALWTSSDARTWTRSAPFATGSVEEVTAFGSDLVAAGTDRNAAGESVASTWVSTDDGSTWERVGAGNPAFRIRQTTQIFGVTAAGPGLVAVGLSYENGGIDAHAWTSADGRSWRRSVDPPAWSGVGDEVLGTACPLPGGGVVALGTVTVAGEQDAWAWVSSDGVNWERATGPGASSLAGAGLQFPADCAPTGTGVLVTGTMAGDGQSDGVLWFTADGRTWTASPFAGPADEGLYGIDVDGARVVLTGREGDDLTVFTSSDGGSTWDKRTALGFAVPGYQTGYPVIAGDEVMLAGRDGASAAVWVGPAPDATNR